MSWISLKKDLEKAVACFKREQRKAIVMSIIAKENGLDLDYLLIADYEMLTKILKEKLGISNGR